MKVKTLLNKLRLKEHQTIRVLDDNAEYFIETKNKKEIAEPSVYIDVWRVKAGKICGLRILYIR